MKAKLLGLFSGFPTHHFTEEIAEVLHENLDRRESLVFISAWPDDHARNDDDSDGMHEMFAERGMAFTTHHVIDRRTSGAEAVKLVREADCIFLMGGESTWQMSLICDLGLVSELQESRAVILGVSAGSMNLGKHVAEIWESKAFYEGIGLTDITIKAHYTESEWFVPLLKELSMDHPIIAMEDESAIFINDESIKLMGHMYLFDKGEQYDEDVSRRWIREGRYDLETERLIIRPFSEEEFDDYFDYIMDPHLQYMLGLDSVIDRGSAWETFQWLLKNREFLALISKETGKAIGHICIHPAMEQILKDPAFEGKTGCSLSFAIAKSMRRKGYMEEALISVMDELFMSRRVDFVDCEYTSFNTASHALQEKFGFRCWGKEQADDVELTINVLKREDWKRH